MFVQLNKSHSQHALERVLLAQKTILGTTGLILIALGPTDLGNVFLPIQHLNAKPR